MDTTNILTIQNDITQKYNISDKSFYSLLLQEIDKQLKIKKWCYNTKLSFENVEILEWKKHNNYGSLKFDDPLPNKIKIKMSFIEGSKIENSDIYEYKTFISSGSYGAVFLYESKNKNKIALKLLNSWSIKAVKEEINISETLYNSNCNVVNTYIINQKIPNSISSNIKLLDGDNNNIYQQRTPRDKGDDLVRYYGMILMPLALGDYSSVIYAKYGINTLKRNFIGYQKILNDLNFFKKIILELNCLLTEHDACYCDLKMQQILVYNCGNEKYNYILGDLGGIYKIDQKESIAITYGPSPSYTGTYYSQDIFLFGISALFNVLFYNAATSKMKYNDILRLDWRSLKPGGENPYNNIDAVVLGPSQPFKANIKNNFSNPADYLCMTVDCNDEPISHYAKSAILPKLKDNLIKIRELLIEWLNKNIRTEDSIPINNKENIQEELNKLIILLN